MVIVLLVFRGTNEGMIELLDMNSADLLPKHIIDAFAQVKNFKRESLSCLVASSLDVKEINEVVRW